MSLGPLLYHPRSLLRQGRSGRNAALGRAPRFENRCPGWHPYREVASKSISAPLGLAGSCPESSQSTDINQMAPEE